MKHFIIFTLLLLTSQLSAAQEYAAPESCAECHQHVCADWQRSDHSRSMQHAAENTVLGNFSNITFRHIGFDDLAELPDAAVKTLLDTLFTAEQPPLPLRNYAGLPSILPDTLHPVPYNSKGRKFSPPLDPRFEDFALACFDTVPAVKEKLQRLMSETQRKDFDAETDYRKKLLVNRPAEITAAQARIVNFFHQLIDRNKIPAASIPQHSVSYRMFREGQRFFVETQNKKYEIRFALGVRPLQQYIVETTGGRLQCLPVAWDSLHQRWFHLYPKEQILPNDPLHWTKPLQNWNTMCADCHTTNFQKNFDAEKLTYQSSYSEETVGCQACHGPCGQHTATAKAKQFSKNWDKSVPLEVFPLSSASPEQTLDSCAFCHTRRRNLKTGAKKPEEPCLNHFVPEMLDNTNYYPDGQLLEEAFEVGSFLQSKMYSRGVSCTNCHNPHTAALKFEGNRLCLQCHSPSLYDTVRHHFHPNSSKPGTQCVECHFPQSVYMVGDPRRDHSIRKPSPALTLAAGVPNACTLCHCDRKKGETLEWANEHVEKWYSEKRKSEVGYSRAAAVSPHYALAIQRGRSGDRKALPDLMKIVENQNNIEYRDIVRASALSLFGQLAGDNALPFLAKQLNDRSDFVQLAAVQAFSQQGIEERLKYLPPKLNVPVLAIRIETARILAEGAEQLKTEEEKRLFKQAEKDFLLSLEPVNDQAASYLNLAVFDYDLSASKRQQVERWFAAAMRKARQEQDEKVANQAVKTRNEYIRKLTDKTLAIYRQSLRTDSDFIPALINSAMLHNERDEQQEAEQAFLEVLRIDPKNGDAAYSLGLLLSEMGRAEDSLKMLKTATELLPDNARIRYNYGVLLMNLSRWTEAETELERVTAIEPENETFRNALTVLQRQKRVGNKPIP
ncbi:MAG: tetratricopeptide repeat protein [Planctomycetaceae bacterium]|nr:tetratricopeptide repeat protein [Planctomycetaceae bacterium]